MGPAGVIECPQCGSSYPAGTLSCTKCKTPFDVPTMYAADPSEGQTIGGIFDPFAAPASFEPGTVLGDRYEIVSLLGEGGMGAVYKAYDRELSRMVALKIIRPDLARSASTMERFKQELILSTKITHRNVIRIYDLGLAGTTKFISMEFIEGKDLSTVLRQAGKLDPTEAAKIIKELLFGLEAAHNAGVVHRDLKPQNIMLDGTGRAVVMDFGIASSVEDSNMTKAGMLMGTPTYMSPEQARGLKVDERSDLFTVGIIFYELLTGQIPFPAETVMGQLLKRIQEKPVPPVQVNPEIPKALSDVVMKCLQVELGDRYQNAKEIRRDIEKFLNPEAAITGPVAPVQLPWYRDRKWLGAMTALLIMIGGEIWIKMGSDKPVAPQKTVTMLVADFANKTGDAVFDGTIEPMVSIAMEGASFITSYNRGEARRNAAELNNGDTRLDEAKAQLVAARRGVNVVVSGSLEKNDDQYRVKVRAIDALNGKEIIARDGKTSRKEEVLTLVGKLIAPVRKALGDVSPESAALAAAETFSASSVDAAHDYAMAQEFQFGAKWDQAIDSYSKAISKDPTLGRAYAGLAVVQANQGKRDMAAKYFQQAMAHIDKMTDREKYRTRGSYYLAVRNIDAAVKDLSQLIQQYPADSAGLNNLSVAYSYKRDMAKAVEMAKRASSIYGKSVLPKMNVASFSLYGGDFATAESEAKSILEINPKYAKAYIVLGLAQLAQGKSKEAAETYAKAKEVSERGASYSANALADLAFYEGRLSESVKILEEGIKGDRAAQPANEEAAASKLLTQANAKMMLKQSGPAQALIEKALAASKQEENLVTAARLYVQLGQEAKAKTLAAELNNRLGQDFQAYAKIIEGEALLKKGSSREAIDTFQESLKISDTWLGHYDLGRAYLEFKAYPEAHSELSTAQKRRGEAAAIFLDEVPTYRNVAALQYYLARALDELQSPGAGAAYKAFLSTHTLLTEDPLAIDAQRRTR